MAQWDVHVNPSQRSRERMPYVVVAQSDLLDSLETRFVVPLARGAAERPGLPKRLAPQFDLAGEMLTLKPHQAGVLMARSLGKAVGSLRAQSHRVVDALDAVISGV
jgi:toxin CcdB